MENKTELKKLIIKTLVDILDQKIDSFKVALSNAKESRDSDTKSSMGDKYETGRAMVQMEIEKYEKQLNQNRAQKDELLKINLEEVNNRVQNGSLVYTNNGLYFISIGFGKMELDKDTACYCISMSSPIGKTMLGKKIGMEFQFQNRKTLITEIV